MYCIIIQQHSIPLSMKRLEDVHEISFKMLKKLHYTISNEKDNAVFKL